MATSASPRPCAGSSNQGAYGPGRVTSRWQERARRAPSRPSATSSPRRSYSGQKRSTWATINVTPALCAAAIMPSASSRPIAIGFSQRTCFPARTAEIVSSAWSAVGTQTLTASIEGASASSNDVEAPPPQRSATACARSASASTTSRPAAPSPAHAWAWIPPAKPAPITATFTGAPGRMRSGPYNLLAYSSVGLRHRVLAAEERVLRHVGRVAARGRSPAERLGERAGCGAAPAPQQTPR